MKPLDRATRWALTLLVLAALATHGVWHDRRFFSAALGVVLLAFTVGGVRVKHRGLWMLLCGAAAGVVGAVLGTFQEPPPGPIPPGLLGVLTAALAAMAVWCAVAGQVLYGGTYAWLLALLSLNGEPTVEAEATLALLGVATVGMVVVTSRLHKAGGRAVAALVLLLGLGPVGAWGFTQAAFSAEGTLATALYRAISGLQLPSGLGLSHSIRLAAVGSLAASDRPLLELSRQTPRLRSQVMDSFDGDAWHTSVMMRKRVPSLPPPTGSELPVEMMLLEDLQDALPAPAGVRKVEGANARVVAGLVMRTNLSRGARLTLHLGPDEMPVQPTPDLETLLQVPAPLRVELEALARGVTTGALDPLAQARALEQWLQTGFEYSLEVDLRGTAPPLLIMLREKRPAYCIYFAGAMALMLRTLGVRSRVVGGFVPEEVNAITGRAMVRERDAHAWVEAWIPQQSRWVPFDPTPWTERQRAVGHNNKPGWTLAAVGAFVAWVRRGWITLREDPVLALEMLAENPVVLTVLALGLGFFVVRLWRRRTGTQRTQLQGPALPRDLARLHARFVTVVQRRAGVRLLAAETDDEFLARIRERAPQHAGAALLFVDAWRRLRFAGDAAARAQVEHSLRQLEG